MKNNTHLKIQLFYNDMSKSQKRIADWLRENPGEIISLSIVELAEKCQSSEATIVRFAKHLGFSGYQGLKIALAREDGTKIISKKITGDETCYEMFEKICNDIYFSLEKTKKSLDKDSMALAAKKILSADRIVIFGLGNSASVAVDASHKLLRVGCNAVAYTDSHMQAISASQLCERDVAIGISHSGSSKDIVDNIKIAKSKGAFTIALTSKGKSPLIKTAEISLCTDADETRYSILALNSRIAQLAIIDTLYTHIIIHRDEKSIDAIDSTEKALMNKKYQRLQKLHIISMIAFDVYFFYFCLK